LISKHYTSILNEKRIIKSGYERMIMEISHRRYIFKTSANEVRHSRRRLIRN
jgi:hypothetical protein